MKNQLSKTHQSEENQQAQVDKKESKVGKRLSEATTRRVIILVLAMLFSVPLFTVTTYVEEPNSYNYGLSLIRELGPETDAGY